MLCAEWAYRRKVAVPRCWASSWCWPRAGLSGTLSLQVSECGWTARRAPHLHSLYTLCRNMHAWLREDPRNVCVVHCVVSGSCCDLWSCGLLTKVALVPGVTWKTLTRGQLLRSELRIWWAHITQWLRPLLGKEHFVSVLLVS
jgi:hypothetical protein